MAFRGEMRRAAGMVVTLCFGHPKHQWQGLGVRCSKASFELKDYNTRAYAGNVLISNIIPMPKSFSKFLTQIDSVVHNCVAN